MPVYSIYMRASYIQAYEPTEQNVYTMLLKCIACATLYMMNASYIVYATSHVGPLAPTDQPELRDTTKRIQLAPRPLSPTWSGTVRPDQTSPSGTVRSASDLSGLMISPYWCNVIFPSSINITGYVYVVCTYIVYMYIYIFIHTYTYIYTSHNPNHR